MKEFHVNTEVYFGERALDRLAQLHYDRVFIVSDPFVVSSGMIKLVTDPLTRAGIAFDVFTDVVPDPPIEKVISGIAAVSEKKAPCIIAVGGGSAIDTAKMNMEILSEQREIEKNYRAIGEWFVSEFQGEVPDAVKDVVAAVNASKEKIAQLEASKKKETAQEAEPVEKSDDAKTCSVCGTVSDSNFCPHCGAPMGK